jgi:hypothetical protein
VVTGANVSTVWSFTTTSATRTRAFGVRATFASPDQARYFFNSGGRLRFFTVGTAGTANGRSQNVVELVRNLGGINVFGANTNGGRVGTGGTVNSSNTAVGYYTSTFNSNVTAQSITSTTSAYTEDSIVATIKTAGDTGTNNDRGDIIDFWFTITSTSGENLGSLTFDDSLNVTIFRRVDVSYPETVNLANTWGAVTVTAL